MFDKYHIIYSYQKSNLKREAQRNSQNMEEVKLVGIFIGLFIQGLNHLMDEWIHYLSLFEVYSTITRSRISVAQKTTWAKFTNSALMTLLFSIFYSKNYYGSGGNLIKNILSLFYNQSVMFINNAILPNIRLIVNKKYWQKRFLQEMELKKGEKSLLTQEQAQELFQDPVFEVVDEYTDLVKTMFITAIYAPAIPIVLVISILGLCFKYAVSKYNLLRSSSVESSLGVELQIEMTELIEYFIIIYAGSQFLFYYILVGSISTYGLLSIIIAIVNAALPMEQINSYFFDFEESVAMIHYSEASQMFLTDYDRENPGIMEYARRMHTLRAEGKQ